MERRQLECFVAIADSGSMAEAARVLLVSQPALSQMMRTLERELGTELFHRLPRGVTLTSAGESLLGPARQVLRDFGTAAARVKSVRGLRGGQLDIVALPGLINTPLAPWPARYRKHWPGVTVRIDQLETADAVADAVRTGRSELGLAVDLEPARDLETLEVGVQELVALLPRALAAKAYAGDDTVDIDIDQLMELGLITGRPGTLIRDLADQSAVRRGISWQPVIEIERREAALAFVRAGAGVAVLPAASRDGSADAGMITLPLRPRRRRAIHLLYRSGPLSPAAAALRDLVSVVIPER